MAPDPAAVKAEMLKIYPAKTAKKRAKQIISTTRKRRRKSRPTPALCRASSRSALHLCVAVACDGPIYDCSKSRTAVGCAITPGRRAGIWCARGSTRITAILHDTECRKTRSFGGEKKLNRPLRGVRDFQAKRLHSLHCRSPHRRRRPYVAK